jgi:lysophospholipase L1-like esterase|tara:strand:+ start:574 stop:1869 length:1296 start_codon:yes stop_codon:yes gene_type:complete
MAFTVKDVDCSFLFTGDWEGSGGATFSSRTTTASSAMALWATNKSKYSSILKYPDHIPGIVVAYEAKTYPQLSSAADKARYEKSGRTHFTAFNFTYKVWAPCIQSNLTSADFESPEKFQKRVATLSPAGGLAVSISVSDFQGAIPPGAFVIVRAPALPKLKGASIVRVGEKIFDISTIFPDPPGNQFVLGTHGAPTILGGSGGGGQTPSPIPTNLPSWPSPLPEVKTNRVLWLGDSQSDNTYLTRTIKAKLKERGIDVKLLAKYGQGVLSGMKAKGGSSGPEATSAGSKADYFGVNKENGHLVSYMKSFRPGLVIVELGGNDSNSYSSSSKKAVYQEQLALWVKTVKDLGAQLIWFGPSFSGKPSYQKKREVIAAYQQEYLTSAGIPWYNMKPLTQDLQHKEETTPVHFVSASYKKWAQRLLDGPLKDVKA